MVNHRDFPLPADKQKKEKERKKLIVYDDMYTQKPSLYDVTIETINRFPWIEGEAPENGRPKKRVVVNSSGRLAFFNQ